jgi:hypothetical protein
MRRRIGALIVAYVVGSLIPLVAAPPSPTPPPLQASAFSLRGVLFLFVMFLGVSYLLTKMDEN